MKKVLYIFLIVATAMFTSCKELDIEVTGVTLNAERTTLTIGERDTLTATLSPVDATNRNVIWTSSDKSIVDVYNGIIEAKGIGTATITAKADAGVFSACCEVKVVEAIVHVDGFKLVGPDNADLKDISLLKGGKDTLSVTVSPADATDCSIIWSSSDTTVFKVSAEGIIEATGSGKATLTAYTLDGGFTQSVVINVSNPAASIVLDSTAVTLYEYKMFHLGAKVEPADNDTKLIWSSDNENLVTVNQLGEIYTKTVSGDKKTATITVASADDPAVCAKCTVTVLCKVLGIKIEDPELYVKEGKTVQAAATVYPARSTAKGIEWKSSNEEVAKVDAKTGLITGTGEGKAIITACATAENGNKLTASCNVTVISRVASISLSQNECSIPCGGSTTLKAAFTPGNATCKDARWSSSDETVATVDSLGKVTAVGVGNASIAVSSCDGGFISFCKVTVTKVLNNISFSEKSLSFYEGTMKKLIPVLEPADATDVSVEWASSDTTVVKILDGTIMAFKAGTAKITAKAGGKSCDCTVSVWAKATGIKLDKEAITINKGETNKITATVMPEGVPEEDKPIIWSSSDETVATVGKDGTVKGLKSGTATITATSAKQGSLKASCQVTVKNPIKGFAIEPISGDIFDGDMVTLTITGITPADADRTEFIWSSSNTSVASVGTDGKVTATSAGTATITAKAKDYPDITASVGLNVLAHVKSIAVAPQTLLLAPGETKELSVTLSPDNASDKRYTVESADNSVVTVSITDGKAVLTAVAVGRTAISVKSVDGGKTATCEVEVGQMATDVSISTNRIEITAGQSSPISASVLPDNAFAKGIIWSSSDGTVAIYDAATGSVIGLKEGSATITATSEDGRASAECAVTVLAASVPVTKITPASATLTMTQGDTRSAVSLSILPANATNKNVKWSTSSSSIVMVDAKSGQLTAMSVGTATITATATDGSGVKCTITVTVKSNIPVVHVESIKILDPVSTLYVGETVRVHAEIDPANATEQGVKWTPGTSSVDVVKATVCTATNNAVELQLLGLKAGKARVTVTSRDMNDGYEISRTLQITVLNRPVESIALDRSGISLRKGETFTLKASLTPYNATVKTMTWASSNTSVATVSSTGLVTALAPGEAVITVTTKDGGKTATCKVKVTGDVNGGTISPVGFNDL